MGRSQDLRGIEFLPLDDISITIAGAMSKSPYPRPRLLITDPSPICREGLSAVLGRDGRFEICRYGYNGKSEAEMIGSHSPDLLLIDPFRNGVDAVWLVKGLADNFPKTRIVVVAYRPEEVYAERILRAGASGYWMKTSEEKELICCIETVLAGNVYLSPRMTLFAVQRLVAAHRIDSSLVGGLTDREL